jgi:hypothetical protein
MSDPKRMDYLIECLRTTREELLFRVKHRDDWLKLQLFAQITILALAGGVKIGGVEASGPLPIVFALSVPISFILVTLYFVQDTLIGYLSRYVGQLSNEEAKLSSTNEIIPNWDVSPECREYTRHALPFRSTALFVAFVLVPAILVGIWIVTISGAWTILQTAEVILTAILWLATLGLVIRVYVLRRKTGKFTLPNLLHR